MHKHEGILAFGCNCGKSRIAASTAPQPKRVTVYQVLNGSSLTGEYDTLSEARKQATEVGGRVKVTSKQT